VGAAVVSTAIVGAVVVRTAVVEIAVVGVAVVNAAVVGAAVGRPAVVSVAVVGTAVVDAKVDRYRTVSQRDAAINEDDRAGVDRALAVPSPSCENKHVSSQNAFQISSQKTKQPIKYNIKKHHLAVRVVSTAKDCTAA
jgi:hypothetical protein